MGYAEKMLKDGRGDLTQYLSWEFCLEEGQSTS